jgi:tRNA (guanine-N7-)-methyltransferase
MGKTKLHKYERVKHLSNVTFTRFGESKQPMGYPWYAAETKGMEKVLELGCGKGEHSLAFAGANPGKLYLGIDSKSHRICVGAEKAVSLNLENVMFLQTRIERIQDFFMPHSVHEIWLTFPDPHLKTRVIKNRLSAPLFLDIYDRLLLPGGRVHLKTDSGPLFDYTRESVQKRGGQVVKAVDDLYGDGRHGAEDGRFGASEGISAFEQAALSRGETIRYLAFTLN